MTGQISNKRRTVSRNEVKYLKSRVSFSFSRQSLTAQRSVSYGENASSRERFLHTAVVNGNEALECPSTPENIGLADFSLRFAIAARLRSSSLSLLKTNTPESFVGFADFKKRVSRPETLVLWADLDVVPCFHQLPLSLIRLLGES